MRLTTLVLLLVLPALRTAHAQSAAAAGQTQAQAPAAEIPLAQRLKAERPEVERLIEAFQPKEALVKAEALLPAQKPAWDNADGNAQYRSYLAFQDAAAAYFLAYRAAVAAGQWEKALDHVKKAQALMVENAANAEGAFPKIAEAYQARAQQGRNALKADEAYIKELRAKANPDAADKQQLDMVAGVEKGIAEDEHWAKAFQGFIDSAKKSANLYDPWVKAMTERLAAEETQIAGYKAGKGEKDKWVEAIVSNPSYLDHFPEKRDKVDFLYRLSVLAPANTKVEHEIDVILGKVPPPAKPGRNKKKAPR